MVYIYTDRLTPLPIPPEELSEDMEMFVIPANRLGESAFLIIDSASDKNSLFYEINISDD